MFRIMNTATLKVGFTAWMRNLMLLFNLTPNQKKLIDTPRRLHGWVQSHLVLKNEVYRDAEKVCPTGCVIPLLAAGRFHAT